MLASSPYRQELTHNLHRQVAQVKFTTSRTTAKTNKLRIAFKSIEPCSLRLSTRLRFGINWNISQIHIHHVSLSSTTSILVLQPLENCGAIVVHVYARRSMHLYGTIVSPTYFALGSIARLDKRIDLRTTVVESNVVYKKSNLLIQKATSKACIKMCQTISETMFEGARARYTRVVNAPCERCINICC